MITREELSATSDAIVDRIKPMLAGFSPELQGSIVMDLFAIWLAGHDPSLHAALAEVHVRNARELAALYRRQWGLPS